MRSIEEIVVIGSGNWGLTLASLFAGGHPVRVWTIDEAMAENLNANRRQPGDFYKFPLPDSIVIEPKYTTRLDENLTLIILAVPSSQVRAVAHELARHARTPLVLSVSKGFDVDGQCTMSQVIQQEIPGASVVVLTGPTIANEVAESKPTRAVLACADLTCLALVKQALRNDVISFEISRDPAHHEMFAALKGIVAIGRAMTLMRARPSRLRRMFRAGCRARCGSGATRRGFVARRRASPRARGSHARAGSGQ